MRFGELLKDLRENKNVTQKDVAKACGLTPTCVCQLETGARNPTGSTIRELAKYFEVSSDYLLGLEDDFGVRTSLPVNIAEHYSKDEKDLIEKYRNLDPRIKKIIRDQLDIYTERGELLPRKDKKT